MISHIEYLILSDSAAIYWVKSIFTFCYLIINFEVFALSTDMGDPEQKARELVAQAEKKMKSSGGFFGNLMG